MCNSNLFPKSDFMLHKRNEFSEIAIVQAFRRTLLLRSWLFFFSKPVRSKPVVAKALSITFDVIEFLDFSIVNSELRTIG